MKSTLAERLAEIASQAADLGQTAELLQLRAQTGDLMARLVALCRENGWNPDQLLAETLAHRKEPAEKIAPPRDGRRVAVFSSTFDPPSRYHRTASERMLELGFDEVVVCPAGPRATRHEREHAKSMHRAAMADLNFKDLKAVSVDLTDLDQGRFSTPLELEQRYQQHAEVWHVVSADSVDQGCQGRCTIQTRWEQGEQMWQRSRFIVLHPANDPPSPEDRPPHCQLLAVDGHVPSAELRDRVYHGESIDEWVLPEVAAYIRRQQLFLPTVSAGPSRLHLTEPRLLIEYDSRNPEAVALAERYKHYISDRPNLILVLGGDGTMLRAIRRHWRRRVPIVGLNAGHVGFLANERLPQELEGAEFVLYSLPMIRVDAERANGERISGLAFGDAWIERDGGQAAWLKLEVDGQTRVPKIVGDGMLVATASGSSAYARALGAIPVPLTTPVFTLAGSNIFRPRFWKPMNLADDTVISIVSLDRSGKRLVRGFIDGQPLGVIQSLTVQRSPIATVELAFTGEFDPSGKLLRSLFPPTEEE